MSVPRVPMFERVGDYHIAHQLGAGGMGEVWVATKVGFGGMRLSVVMKFLHAHLGRNPKVRAYFINEAKLAALLDHPNVVKVTDAGEADDRLYLVMEYVDGVNLTDFLKFVREKGRTLPLPVNVTCYIIGEVLKGLVYAHELTMAQQEVGIMHLDVTPNNVLISSSGNVKVTDFGLSRVAAGTDSISCVAGTPRYMPPEVHTATPRRRSDVYGVGAIAYELLTNTKLHDGLDNIQIKDAIMRGVAYPIRRDDLKPWLVQVVNQMLAHDYNDRPTSRVASEFFLRNSEEYGQASLELAKMYKDVVGAMRSGHTGFLKAVSERRTAPERHRSFFHGGAEPARPLHPPSQETIARTMSTPPPIEASVVAREPDAPTLVEPPGMPPAVEPPLVEQPGDDPIEATELLPGFADSQLPEPTSESTRATSNAVAPAIAAPVMSVGAAQTNRLLWVGAVLGAIALASLGWTIGTLAGDREGTEPEVAAGEAGEPDEPDPTPPPLAPPNELEPVPVPEVDEAQHEPEPPFPDEATPTPEPEGAGETGVDGDTEAEAKAEEAPKTSPRTSTKPKKASKRVMVVLFIKGYHGAGAIKLGSKQYTVRGGYVKIPKLAPGTYRAKWRTGDEDPWHDAGKIVLEDIAPNYYQFHLGEGTAKPTITTVSGK